MRGVTDKIFCCQKYEMSYFVYTHTSLYSRHRDQAAYQKKKTEYCQTIVENEAMKMLRVFC